MQAYDVTIEGLTPLLMHADNIEWADKLDAWKLDPANKRMSKAGDDRSPAWRWLGCVYHADGVLVIPTDNIMRSLLEGGAMVPVPGGRMGKTFKAQTQSGIIPDSVGWPLRINGNVIRWDAIAPLMSADAFPDHIDTARRLGFDLFAKRARIGQAKHVRIRPIFTGWSASGRLTVTDPQITGEALATILDCAGRYKGLCDWRPGGRTPGVYGMFRATIRAA